MVMLVLIVAGTVTVIVIVFVIRIAILILNTYLIQPAIVTGKTAPEQALCLLLESSWVYGGDAWHLLKKQREKVFLVVQSYKIMGL